MMRNVVWRRGGALVILAMLAAVLLAGSGCGGYQLRGMVVYGEFEDVQVVAREAEAKMLDGLGGVSVSSRLDPEQMTEKRLATVVTDESGRFSIPVKEFGAGSGVLQYEIELVFRGRRLSTLAHTMPLPREGQRVVVTMVSGRGVQGPPRDLLEETIELGEQLRR